jgi:hypothetical protein
LSKDEDDKVVRISNEDSSDQLTLKKEEPVMINLLDNLLEVKDCEVELNGNSLEFIFVKNAVEKTSNFKVKSVTKITKVDKLKPFVENLKKERAK